MIHTFVCDPLKIPSIALSYAKQRELVEQYARAYSDEHGESISEYVSRIGVEVYPGHRRTLHGVRANFRNSLRAEIRKIREKK